MSNKHTTIQQFCSAAIAELQHFQNDWFASIYCTLSEEERDFWDYNATMWDWADYYDMWVANKR